MCHQLTARERQQCAALSRQVNAVFTAMVGNFGLKSLCRSSSVRTTNRIIIYFNRPNTLSISLTR